MQQQQQKKKLANKKNTDAYDRITDECNRNTDEKREKKCSESKRSIISIHARLSNITYSISQIENTHTKELRKRSVP